MFAERLGEDSYGHPSLVRSQGVLLPENRRFASLPTRVLPALSTMKVSVYVLEFSGGHRYVGMTSDLDRRLEEHRRRQSPSTRLYAGEPVVVYTRDFATYAEARKHEKFMKSGAGRRSIT